MDPKTMFKRQQTIQGIAVVTALANIDGYIEYTTHDELLDRDEFYTMPMDDCKEDDDLVKRKPVWSINKISETTCWNIIFNFACYSQFLLVAATLGVELSYLPTYCMGINESAFVTVTISNQNLIEHLKYVMEKYGKM